MHSKINNIEIMQGSEADEIIEEFFESLLEKYLERLEERMKEVNLFLTVSIYFVST